MSEFVLESGTILAGKYRIESVIGRGGMGIVMAAHHLQLEQRVALKLMLPQALTNPDSVVRFLREARAAARISSEHVARVFDVGSLPSGEPYIAMEYLQGSDLAQLLKQRRRFAADDAVDYVLQACEALAEAHEVGIIHRDLKPGNLYLTKRIDGQRLIKVLDFGISKVVGVTAGGAEVSMTQSSEVMGSPQYMSPEQLISPKTVDARSDLWALGVVLYEMLCGIPPFDGETMPQLCMAIVNRPTPPLAARAPNLPPLLAAVIERCLQKAAAARFQTVAEFAQALSPLASPRARQSIERISFLLATGATQRVVSAPAEVAAATEGNRSPSASPLAPGTQATWTKTESTRPGKRELRVGLWTAAAMSGASLLGAVVWFTQRLPVAPSPTAGSAAVALEAISARDVQSAAPVGQTAEIPRMTANAVAGAASPAAGTSAVRRSVLFAQRTGQGVVLPNTAGKAANSIDVPNAASVATVAATAPAATPNASTISKPLAPPIRSRL
ncbi:MAG: serine/threonine-protein kinase [Pseudomonadota bacterium]